MMHARGYFYNDGFWGSGFFGSGWTWLIALGILLIVIAVTYLIIKASRTSIQGYDALEALKVKLVQGEITEEEYNKRKSIIKK